MTLSLDAASLAALVGSHIPVAPAEVKLTPIGTGKHNASYWVDTELGRFVLRLAPPDDTGFLFYERHMMRQEPQLHDLVRAHTSIPVPEIIVYDFSRAHIDRDYLLMSTLSGQPLSNARLTHRQLGDVYRQVGRYLRQLHELTALTCVGTAAYGYLGAHHPMESQPTWAAAFTVMWNKLLDDVVASGCYSPSEAQEMRDLLEHYRAHFDRSVAPSLLHMDIWSENILVNEHGQVSGIIDFDRALWGDPEIEFAVLDYTGFSEAEFWQGYGRERDESPSAQIRQRFYLLYEVQKYMPLEIWKGNNVGRARSYKRHCLDLAAPLGFKH